jgi:hypothetical protein
LGWVNLMVQSVVNWTEKRKELVALRNRLFKEFEADPWNIRTGQEIKRLDDEVAECVEHLAVERSKNQLV